MQKQRPVSDGRLSGLFQILLLYECEKHPREIEWDDTAIYDRILGILVQLISCLQNRRCPHYFLPALNLHKGVSPAAMDTAARQVWRLLRDIMFNPKSLEKL